MIDQLKQVAVTVLQKLAELKKELAEAKGQPAAEPAELTAANERAAAAEAKARQLEETLANISATDTEEDAAIADLLGQFNAALAE